MFAGATSKINELRGWYFEVQTSSSTYVAVLTQPSIFKKRLLILLYFKHLIQFITSVE